MRIGSRDEIMMWKKMICYCWIRSIFVAVSDCVAVDISAAAAAVADVGAAADDVVVVGAVDEYSAFFDCPTKVKIQHEYLLHQKHSISPWAFLAKCISYLAMISVG